MRRGLNSVEIIIYNTTISHRENLDDSLSDKSLSNEDVIGVLGVHEGTHATNKESNSVTAPAKSDTEKLPMENEKKHIKELKIKTDEEE